MAFDPQLYADFVGFVQADLTTNYTAYYTDQQPGGSGGYLYPWLAINRDLAILGFPPFNDPTIGPVPTLFAGWPTPLLFVPAGTKIPALSADLLSTIAFPAATLPPAPTTPTTPAPTTPTTPAPTTPTTPAPTTPVLGGRDLFAGGVADYCDLYPDDPLCDAFFNESGPGGINVTQSTEIENVTIVQDGISGTDVTGIVNDALDGLWKAAVGAADAAIAEAVGDIQAALTALGNALNAAWQILNRLAGFILNLLQQMLAAVEKGILDVLVDVRNLLGDLYKNVLVPIAHGMLNIRQALLDVYQRFIRPMLIVLQDIRRVLSILAAFHVSFAAKLDAKLASLEARITQPLFYLLSFVNGVANWINLIVTAGYLLQKSLFLNSLQAYLGEAINLQLNGMNPPPDPAAIVAAQQANAVPTAAQAVDDFSAFITTDSGSLPATIAQYNPTFEEYLSQSV